MLQTMLIFVAFTLLFASAPATSTPFKTVNISDAEHLKEYLCSSKRTIPPYTHLVIKQLDRHVELNNTGMVCLVENTTDIYISGWRDDSAKDQSPVIVYCVDGGGGFGFFNVTNLTMESVQFRGCGWWGIPADITKYVNGSDQFLYYDVAQTVFLFNHCSNLKLYNVLGYNDINISTIGVNLCGWSNITSVIPDGDLPHTPLSTVAIYYTDSDIMPSNPECNLHFESNVLSGNSYIDIDKDLGNNIERMPVRPIRDFALYITQQDFKVNVNITVHPMLFIYNIASICGEWCGTSNVIIMFVNSISDSHVTFQGYPYEFCSDQTSIPPLPGYHSYRSMQLDVVFYETPSFNGSVAVKTMAPLSIQNTSFAFYARTESMFFWVFYASTDILRVLQFSKELSYEVTLDNIAWCNNSIFFDYSSDVDKSWHHLLNAHSFFLDGLHLKMNNVYMQHNVYGGTDEIRQTNSDTLIRLVNVACTLSGANYFRQNCGGSVISAVSSNITITGNLTVSDGDAHEGGGMRLDSYSYLFLKEPLFALFINNSAHHGSAIFAPAHMNTAGGVDTKTISAIQISPSNIYSQGNLSDIDIKLHFQNNTGLSLYAPEFGFLGRQISTNFLFDSYTWDANNSWYVYTALIDTIFQGKVEDKFTSLSNGVCFGISGKKLNCSYVDHHFHISPTPSIDVYPGASLSLFCSDYKQYQLSYYYQDWNDITAIRRIPCKTKEYKFWKTSILETNLSLTFPFPGQQPGDVPASYNLYLMNTEISKSVQFLTVNVLSECPMGFKSFNLAEGGACKCISVLRNHGFKCSIDTLRFTSPPDSWIDLTYRENGLSYHLDQILLSTHCPPNYCKNGSSHDFTLYKNDPIADTFCHSNRSGILCGQCTNYSAVFGSDACHSNCSDLYLFTLPVYAIVGLLLVVALFALNLTVATGTINGAIFYANILNLSMDVFSPGNTKFNLSPLRIIISLLNLNLGFPVCLYEGMTTSSKAGFQFVFPVYLWAIVLGLIIASRYSVRLSNAISRSSVQVLATLFYLSFSKIIVSTIYVVSATTVFAINDVGEEESTLSNGSFTAWYYDGSVYGQGAHGWLVFVVAVFIAVFLLPYTLLLTFSYHLMRFKIFNKFRPFLDAYGGPFRDSWRFWFGLRLWLTAILLSVDGALQGTDAKKMVMAHFVIILVFILLQAHVHPFRSQLIGALDMFFMLNYSMITLLYLLTSESTFLEAYIVLLCSAILTMGLIVTSHLFYSCVYLKKQEVFLNWKVKMSNKFKKYKMVVNEEGEGREDSDDDLFHAAEERVPVDTY